MDFLRRNFAAPMADGDYAVPSLANPVSVDPVFMGARSDFLENSKAGQVVDAFGNYWSGIWDIMTGNTEVEPEHATSEAAAKASTSGAAPGSGDMGYLLFFGLAIGALYFFRKGGF